MLKRAALVAGLVAGFVAHTHGQGTVNFNTLTLGTTARVYDSFQFTSGTIQYLGAPFYGPGYVGTNFFAQLYSAAGTGVATDSLTAAGNPTFFQSAGAAGYVATASSQTGGRLPLGNTINAAVTVTAVAGGPATVQMRAWWNNGQTYTTYQSAIDGAAAGNANSRWGASPVLNLGATGTPPATPPNLTGLLGFQLVPEPATWALAGLGGAALLLLRRRK